MEESAILRERISAQAVQELKEREKRLLKQLERNCGVEKAVRSSVVAAIDRLNIKETMVTSVTLAREIYNHGYDVEAAILAEYQKYLVKCLSECESRGLVTDTWGLTPKGRRIGRDYNQQLYS